MIDAISGFFAWLPREIYVFVISVLPIIELRGSIPVGAALEIPFYINYPLSVIGNLLPVPFILLFIPKILAFLGRFKPFAKLVNWLHEKARRGSKKVIGEENALTSNTEDIPTLKMTRAIFLALMIFVAIPLPGTGAWTGALVASLFNIEKRWSFLAITLGVLISGAVMCLASYGVLGFLKFFL